MKALLLIFASIFYDPVIVDDHFEMIEINTIRQNDGSIRLKQYIWWDVDGTADICHGWLDWKRVGRMPVRVGDHCELVWWDGRVCRRVSARVFIVTETWGRDPEVDNRQLVPLTHRRGLSEP